MWKIFIFLAFLIYFILVEAYPKNPVDEFPPDCDHPIYCHGEILKTVLLSGIFSHPKDFVDQKLKRSPAEVIADFESRDFLDKRLKELPEDLRAILMESELVYKLLNPTAVQDFVDTNFAKDLPATCKLTDFKERPHFVEKIQDPVYQQFMIDVHKIWLELSAHIDEDAKENPDRHSFVYVSNCYIKAGGFFTAMFYWDSFWIIKGLTLSQMTDTAKGMILNFAELIDKFGFILNATRLYYSSRSQPPYFAAMVKAYVDAEPQDVEFLKQILPKVEKEFNWWLENRAVTFTKDGLKYTLYQYRQNSCQPRPEGYNKDYNKAEEFENKEDKDYFYTQTHSVAESGLDFSTRQRRPGFHEPGYGTRKNLDITGLVPVELNSLLAMNARYLSEWFEKFGDTDNADKYKLLSEDLIELIEKVFWSSDHGAWFDWDIKEETHRTNFYPTNLSPLYTKSYDQSKASEYGEKAVNYLIDQKIIHANGTPKFFAVPTSMIQSPEQWDFKNGWSPMQSFIIEGLYHTGNEKAKDVALELAKIWVKTNYKGFVKYDFMFEKYSAIELGTTGGGGTYTPQTGFGWSNGLLTILFSMFPDKLKHTDYENFVPDEAGVDKISVVKL